MATQQQKILERLERAGELGVTNIQLNNTCYRYAARIHELRKQGYDISTIRLTDSIRKYVLHPKTSELVEYEDLPEQHAVSWLDEPVLEEPKRPNFWGGGGQR